MNHGTKHGVGYLAETTVDSKHGIITGMDVYPANEKRKSDRSSPSGEANVASGFFHTQTCVGQGI
jgi:hypothetical protein